MTEKLKPCPFCGGDNLHIEQHGVWTGRSLSVTHYTVEHICREGVTVMVRARYVETCAERWNTRAEMEKSDAQ